MHSVRPPRTNCRQKNRATKQLWICCACGGGVGGACIVKANLLMTVTMPQVGITSWCGFVPGAACDARQTPPRTLTRITRTTAGKIGRTGSVRKMHVHVKEEQQKQQQPRQRRSSCKLKRHKKKHAATLLDVRVT